jgi:DNA-binding transcriptional LysR family regulator
MELKQLQALVAISEHGSFSAAAKALDTVQSNVSAHLSRLEKELGSSLIDRASGELTDEGEMVLARAKRILHEVEDIDTDIHSLGDSVSGDCRIGTLGTTARWLMPPLLNSLTRHHPGVRLTIVEGASSALMLRLMTGEIDAALVHFPIAEANVETKEMFAEELLLLAPKKHVLASHETISLEELSEHPIMLAPRGTAARRIIDRAAASKGVALRPQAEIDGMRLMASLVFEGFGAAIVPASAVPGWLKGDFVRIGVPDLPRRVVGWVQRERPRPNRATLAVRDVAFEVAARHASRQPGISLENTAKQAKGTRG